MQVSDLMKTHVITATADTSLKQVWKLLSQKHIHSLLIVDAKQKLSGIVVKEDFLRQIFPNYEDVVEEMGLDNEQDEVETKLDKLKHLKAGSVMNSRVLFTRPDTNLMRALSRMIVQRVRQLPVLDDSDRVVGVISKGDIFDSLFHKK